MHPLFEEILRTQGVGAVQAHCFNRWQRQLRDEIQPMLDELETLRAEKLTWERWKAEPIRQLDLAPPKRPRGRPRKHPLPVEAA